jgi:hypothetical protein
MKEREWLSLPFTSGRAEENRIKTSQHQHVGILGWSRMTISLKPNEGDKAVCRGKDVVWWAWPVLSNAASWGRVQLSIWPPLQAERGQYQFTACVNFPTILFSRGPKDTANVRIWARCILFHIGKINLVSRLCTEGQLLQLSKWLI